MTLLQLVEIVGASLTFLLVIAGAWRGLGIGELKRRTGEFLDDWQGETARPGRPARPGAMARLAQLENNSGSTMRDVVDEIRAQVGGLRSQVDGVQLVAERANAAAGVAVEEAKGNRRHLLDLNRLLRRDDDDQRRREAAYVHALNALGMPLAPIVEAVAPDPAAHRPDRQQEPDK